MRPGGDAANVAIVDGLARSLRMVGPEHSRQPALPAVAADEFAAAAEAVGVGGVGALRH